MCMSLVCRYWFVCTYAYLYELNVTWSAIQYRVVWLRIGRNMKNSLMTVGCIFEEVLWVLKMTTRKQANLLPLLTWNCVIECTTFNRKSLLNFSDLSHHLNGLVWQHLFLIMYPGWNQISKTFTFYVQLGMSVGKMYIVNTTISVMIQSWSGRNVSIFGTSQGTSNGGT